MKKKNPLRVEHLEVNTPLGPAGPRYFVNSAQGVDRDAFEQLDRMGNSFDGSLRNEDLMSFICEYESESIPQDALVIGSVRVRESFEYIGNTIQGKPYTRQHANRLRRKFSKMKTIEVDGTKLEYCLKSDLLQFANAGFRPADTDPSSQAVR